MGQRRWRHQRRPPLQSAQPLKNSAAGRLPRPCTQKRGMPPSPFCMRPPSPATRPRQGSTLHPLWCNTGGISCTAPGPGPTALPRRPQRRLPACRRPCTKNAVFAGPYSGFAIFFEPHSPWLSPPLLRLARPVMQAGLARHGPCACLRCHARFYPASGSAGLFSWGISAGAPRRPLKLLAWPSFHGRRCPGPSAAPASALPCPCTGRTAFGRPACCPHAAHSLAAKARNSAPTPPLPAALVLRWCAAKRLMRLAMGAIRFRNTMLRV